MHDVMRVNALMLAMIVACAARMCGCAKLNAAVSDVSKARAHKPASAASSMTGQKKVDFNAQVRPILETRCTPCHFAGGKMYERLPFDRAETIKSLGTKLFTRIKDESEQQLIREFLSQE
jgi:uncharacterized membrane protein